MQNKRTSDLFVSLIEKKLKDKKDIEVSSLINFFEHKSFGFLLLLFSIPTAFPVLPPGLSTICGVPMIFLALQLLLGFKSPYLPKFIAKKKLPSKSLKTILNKSIPYLVKIEKYIKPRAEILTGNVGEKIISLVILILAVIISLPIFFANMVPSLGIIFLSLAIIERDGISAIIGYLFSILGIIIASLVVVLGVEFVVYLFEKIFQ
jgi:hypothetical protein